MRLICMPWIGSGRALSDQSKCQPFIRMPGTLGKRFHGGPAATGVAFSDMETQSGPTPENRAFIGRARSLTSSPANERLECQVVARLGCHRIAGLTCCGFSVILWMLML